MDFQLLEYFFSFLLAFSVAFVISPRVLVSLKKLHFAQEIREEGPQSHLSKAGTPTMGGVIFIIAITASTLILNFRAFSQNYLFLLYLFLFAAVGFMDDYVKVINKRNLGLTGKQKLLIQILFALILTFLTLKSTGRDTNLIVPFTNYRIKLGMFYIPFTVLTIVATTNSVNLTDGLDGLASSVTSIVMLTFGIIAMNGSFISQSMFAFAVSGGCLGFLRINAYPAKSFMGDTGSMALGGAVCAVAISMNMHLIIILAGLVYLIESLSVIIQVIAYKRFKKRVFKMSPFHHHLELSGYKETKVVRVFCIITAIMCLISVLSTRFF